MSEAGRESLSSQAMSALKKLTSGGIRLAVMILFVVVAWRIAWSDFTMDLSKFDFSDLLATILALFAVGMSVAFYFKTTDSTNMFYDNIYNFTQKTSEILGRIEERFGEQLRHLDEGYGRIQSRVEDIAKTPYEIEEKVEKTKEQEEEEKKKLEKTDKAIKEMMETLTKKANMEKEEKLDFYRKMEELANEKALAQMRIKEIETERDQMGDKLLMLEKEVEGVLRMDKPSILTRLLQVNRFRRLLILDAPDVILQNELKKELSRLPVSYIKLLMREGVINKDKELTNSGIKMLRNIFSSQE